MIGNVSKEEQNVLLQKAVRGLLNDPRPDAWEKEFLASISGQLLVRELSEKQLAILNRIRQKCRNPAK